MLERYVVTKVNSFTFGGGKEAGQVVGVAARDHRVQYRRARQLSVGVCTSPAGWNRIQAGVGTAPASAPALAVAARRHLVHLISPK
jgi:hypothetical protein